MEGLFSTSLALCEGNPPMTNAGIDVFFVIIVSLKKLLSDLRCHATMWHHCDAILSFVNFDNPLWGHFQSGLFVPPFVIALPHAVVGYIGDENLWSLSFQEFCV